MKSFQRLLWVCALCFGWVLSAQAGTVQEGSILTARTVSDQFGQAVVLNATTRSVVFSAEREVNAFVSDYFSGKGSGFMQSNGVVYWADISAMPAWVTRTFALPKMRQLNFSVGLANTAALLSDVPRKAGHATVIRLNHGVVQSVDYAGSGTQLAQKLGL